MAGHLDKWVGRVAKWLGTAILLFVMFVSISMCGGYACRSPSTPTTQVPTPTRPTWTPETASGPTNTRTPRPPTRTPTPEVVTYVVQKGDTLYSIARKYNVTVEDLAAWNNIKNPRLIYTGQVLIIKPSTNTPPTPTNTPRLPSQRPPCRCDGNYYNCADFGPQADAQACFDYCWRMVGYDVHRLDRDRDRIACEWNP